MTENSSEKLRFGTKIAYGVGDTFGGGALIVIGIYYLYFLTDVVKIDPALAGIVLLLSKIWDAVSDPIMGFISDRTRTRFGRRRPYFLAGIVFVFLATFLLWYPVDFDLELHRFVFVLFAYIFFSTIITMVHVPYTALSSELTLDYSERTSLVSVRMWFSGLSALVCAAVPLEVVKHFPDVRHGYVAMGIFLGLFFALPFIAVFLFTRERPEFQSEVQPLDIRQSVREFMEPFRMRSFRNVLFMYVFSFMTFDVVMAIIIYFMTYYLKKSDQTNYVFATLFIVKLVFIPVLYVLSQRLNKKTSFAYFCFFMFITMVLSFVIAPDSSIIVLHLFAAALGIAVGGIAVLVWAIFPDITDVDELYSGLRREGIYSGIFTFARKVSSAVALFIISMAMSLSGYRPPVKETVDGVVKMIPQEQTGEFIIVLRVVFVVVPALFLLISFLNSVWYPLSPGLHNRLKEFLIERRSGKGKPDLLAAQEQEFKEILIEPIRSSGKRS
jgi:oligogalacturonide transporter